MPNDMAAEFEAKWLEAIKEAVGAKPPASVTWRGLDDVISALEPFMGQNKNHGHLPTGGGMDLKSVRRSRESGCLEFSVGDGTAYLMKPEKLTFEYIKIAPVESFLLLQLTEIEEVGLGRSVADRCREHLLEIGETYLDYAIWSRGYLKHNEGGDEVPIPESARIVCRFFKGTIMIVAKNSFWNNSPDTYSGLHDKMSLDQIKQIVEKSLD